MAAPLDIKEVQRRLDLYTDTKVTDELYSFGQGLVTSAVEYLNKLDGKAGTVITYSGGLLTVILTTSPFWGKFVNGAALLLLVGTSFALVICGVLAALSMNLKKAAWYSDNDWLREAVITDPDRLRRYHVLTMWTVLDSHRKAGDEKLVRLKQSIKVLYAALVLLALAVGVITYTAVAQSSNAASPPFAHGDD